MGFRFALEYGWAARKIEQQMQDYGFDVDAALREEASRWQLIADAILTLGLHGYLPDSQRQKIRNRLARAAEKWLVENKYMVAADDD